jgi:hypothetical protein
VLVLSEKQTDWKDRVHETEASRVLVQPVTLRDLRKTVKRTLGGNHRAPEVDEPENGDT